MSRKVARTEKQKNAPITNEEVKIEGNLAIAKRTILKRQGMTIDSERIFIKETWNNYNKGTDKAVAMSYKEAEKIVMQRNYNSNGNTTKYQINLLFDVGWRGGKFFSGQHVDLIDLNDFYDDDQGEGNNNAVYGIEILTMVQNP